MPSYNGRKNIEIIYCFIWTPALAGKKKKTPASRSAWTCVVSSVWEKLQLCFAVSNVCIMLVQKCILLLNDKLQHVLGICIKKLQRKHLYAESGENL